MNEPRLQEQGNTYSRLVSECMSNIIEIEAKLSFTLNYIEATSKGEQLAFSGNSPLETSLTDLLGRIGELNRRLVV
jgi:hypothetical protein